MRPLPRPILSQGQRPANYAEDGAADGHQPVQRRPVRVPQPARERGREAVDCIHDNFSNSNHLWHNFGFQ